MKLEWLKMEVTFLDHERDCKDLFFRDPVRQDCWSDEQWEKYLEGKKLWGKLWQKFKGKFREGDELWTFSSSLGPAGSKVDLAYRSGVCIVRDGNSISNSNRQRNTLDCFVEDSSQ